MKHLLPCLIVLLCVSNCHAGMVSGYTRRDGTYVSGYNRSNSNNTVMDNYSHKGNQNPFTGSQGHDYDRGKRVR